MQPYKITFACKHFIKEKNILEKMQKIMDAGVKKTSLNCIKCLTLYEALFSSEAILYIYDNKRYFPTRSISFSTSTI